MFLITNEVVVLSLRIICIVVLTDSSNRIGISHLMKYLTINFHLFLEPLCLKSSLFVSVTKKLCKVGSAMTKKRVLVCIFESLFKGWRLIPNTYLNRGWYICFLCYARE